MNLGLNYFILTLLITQLVFTKAYAENCRIHFRDRIYQAEQLNARERRGYVNLSHILTSPEQNELIIGLADYGHVYLMLDGLRFEGSPYNLRTTKKTKYVNEGALLKFAIDEKTAQKIKLIIERKNKTLAISCAHDTCRVLNEAGVSINGARPLWQSFGPNLIEHLIQDGIIVGEKGIPLHAEIILINGEDGTGLDTFFNNFVENRDGAIITTLAILFTGGVFATLTFLYITHEEKR